MGQSAPKNKGKISRMLAAKTSLCARVDALGEDTKPSIGIGSRAKVEERIRQCEQEKVGGGGGGWRRASGSVSRRRWVGGGGWRRASGSVSRRRWVGGGGMEERIRQCEQEKVGGWVEERIWQCEQEKVRKLSCF